MSQEVDLTQLGGLFTYQDTLDFLQQAYGKDIKALAAFAGEKYVLTGCAEDGAGNVADGYIVVDGEVMQFFGAAYDGASQVIINTVLGDEGFDDGSLKTIYTRKTATIGNAGGFDYTDLKRLPFAATSIADAVTKLADIVKSIIQFEPEVILSGPDECDISAGLVMFDGEIIASPAYTGAYPAYLQDDGSWVTVAPAGLYITFDPHTSQRYANVLDRAITPDERIVMQETLSDRFNTGTGLGRWEMKGYILMQELQSRVPKGLWYDGVPVANVTDAVHAADGNTGGEKNHILAANEQGTFTAAIKTDDIINVVGGGGNADVSIRFNGALEPADGSANAAAYGAETTVPLSIAANGHNNQEPFLIIVYAKRVV